jgi:hypothetical protein
MRILEIISEQTIGTSGSTTGQPGQVQQVSQPPGTAGKPADPSQQKPDPMVQQLTALLKQNKVVDNEKDINGFLGAAQATLDKKALNPDQQELMGKLAGPMMTDPKLIDKIKLLMPKKPGSTGQQMQAPPGAPV